MQHVAMPIDVQLARPVTSRSKPPCRTRRDARPTTLAETESIEAGLDENGIAIEAHALFRREDLTMGGCMVTFRIPKPDCAMQKRTSTNSSKPTTEHLAFQSDAGSCDNQYAMWYSVKKSFTTSPVPDTASSIWWPLTCVNGGGIMPHAERPGGPVAAAQKCATYGPLSVVSRGGGCTAWSSMRRFVWRLSMRV